MTMRPLLHLVLWLPVLAWAQEDRANDQFLGAAAWGRPAYQGADTMRTDPIPMLRFFGTHWFARTTQGQLEGGYRVALTPTLVAGAQLSYEAGRRTRDSAFLIAHRVEDLDAGAALGAHLEWDEHVGKAPVNVLARWRQNLDTDQGAKADLRVTVGVLGTERLRAGVFTQLTWASNKASQSYFGITPAQSAATGLPGYTAGSGIRYGALGLLASFDLARHWMLLGSLEVHRLAGDAKDSPFTRDATNYYLLLGAAYRF
ncbi:MAG: MipA/OmpV family protein [Betaproteobacteria bacterium]